MMLWAKEGGQLSELDLVQSPKMMTGIRGQGSRELVKICLARGEFPPDFPGLTSPLSS